MRNSLLQIDFDKVGVYSPSSRGGSHYFCQRQKSNGLRMVPFVEGFIFICDMKILDHFCPVNTERNLYGWGLDIAKGYFSKREGKVCVIDDTVEVEHLPGTGYSRELAEYEMLEWIKTLNEQEILVFFEEQLKLLKDNQAYDIR
jgi:hypothetical protein